MKRQAKLNIDNLRGDIVDKLTNVKLSWRFQLAFLIIASIFFITTCYVSYVHTVKPVETDAIPIISSDNLPIRSKPEDPGGIVFSNQDKSIYNNLRNNILDEPELNHEHVENNHDVYNIISKIQSKHTPKQDDGNIFDLIEENDHKSTGKKE